MLLLLLFFKFKTKLGRASTWFLVKLVLVDRGGAAEKSRAVGKEERHEIVGFISAISLRRAAGELRRRQRCLIVVNFSLFLLCF